MDALRADFRYALRLLRKAPAFAAVAIATLALGIGANTAVFSAADALLIRALPYAQPDQIVMIWEDATFAGFPRNTPAPGNFTDWARLNRSFSAIAAVRGTSANITGDGVPEMVVGRAVTAGLFPVLGVAPVIGRAFTEAEDRSSAQVVVISYGLWQRRYAGERSILGQTLLLSGARYEIIGVMPRTFVFRARDVDYWIPMSFSPEAGAVRGSHYLNVAARLAPGVTLQAARDDMRRVDEELARQYPNSNAKLRSVVIPMKEDLLGNAGTQVLVLIGAAAAVLLIACANLASLLLARAAGRRGELAVRAAVGATPGRLVGQMLVEAMTCSVIGGGLGLALAPAGIALLAQLTPRGFPIVPVSILDARVLVFTLMMAVIAGVAFSALPALQVARASLRDALQQDGRSEIGERSRLKRDALVVVQVAAALVLLVTAGLLLRTLANLRGIDIGFKPDNVLTLRTTLPQTKYGQAAPRLAFYDRVVAGVRALPGVQGAAYISVLPFTSAGNTTGYGVEGRTREPDDPGDALNRVATGDYLRTLGVQLVEGRLLDERDGADAPLAVVVNETLARRHWPGGTALGYRLWFGNPNGPRYTIVGVVKDVHERGYQLAMKPGIYRTFAQQPATIGEYLFVRAKQNPSDLAEPIRRIIAGIDPDEPISMVRTMDEIIDLDTVDRQQQMTLLGIFAGLALILAAIGLYGVLSYAVAQRSRELGLRLALGATRASLMRLVVGRGLTLTAAGLTLGVVLAIAATRTMQNLLVGVTTVDPVTFAAVIVTLSIIALTASYLPARRAARLDPIVVLRGD